MSTPPSGRWGWIAVFVLVAACGDGGKDGIESKLCDEAGRCWRVHSYGAKPSNPSCVTDRVYPCEGEGCPPHRYLQEPPGECRPFGESGRSFCTSGIEVWLDPLGGVTRWERQKRLESTGLCVEHTGGWEYRACMVHPSSYRWRTCEREGRSGVALDWTLPPGDVPDDGQFRIVVATLVE